MARFAAVLAVLLLAASLIASPALAGYAVGGPREPVLLYLRGPLGPEWAVELAFWAPPGLAGAVEVSVGRVRAFAVDPRSGVEAWSWEAAGAGPAALSSGARLLAVAHGGRVAVLNASTGAVVARLGLPWSGASLLSWEPGGGRLLAANRSGLAVLVVPGAHAGGLLWQRSMGGLLLDAAWAPGGVVVAAVLEEGEGAGRVVLEALDAGSGRPLWSRVLASGAPPGAQASLAPCPGRGVVAAGVSVPGGEEWRTSVFAVDPGSGRLLWSTGWWGSNSTLALACGPRGLLAASSGGTVRVYRAGDGRLLGEAPARVGRVLQLAWNPRWGLLAVAGTGGASIVSPRAGRPLWLAPSRPGGSLGGTVYGLAWSHGGDLLVAASDAGLAVYTGGAALLLPPPGPLARGLGAVLVLEELRPAGAGPGGPSRLEARLSGGEWSVRGPVYAGPGEHVLSLRFTPRLGSPVEASVTLELRPFQAVNLTGLVLGIATGRLARLELAAPPGEPVRAEISWEGGSTALTIPAGGEVLLWASPGTYTIRAWPAGSTSGGSSITLELRPGEERLLRLGAGPGGYTAALAALVAVAVGAALLLVLLARRPGPR